MARLTVNTVETAPEKAKERIAAVEKANGFIPNLIGVLSNSPQALEMYQEVGKMNSRNSLTPQEIEVIQITAAAHNGCDFCVAGHTKVGTKLKMPENVPVVYLRKRCASCGHAEDAPTACGELAVNQLSPGHVHFGFQVLRDCDGESAFVGAGVAR